MPTVKDAWVAQMKSEGATVLDDVLQKSKDPVADLKAAGDRVAVVVPFEWAWDASIRPFTNPDHIQKYDADLLSQHLQEAGYTSEVLRILTIDNFVFLTAQAVKRPPTSAERRKAARAALQPKKEIKEVVV